MSGQSELEGKNKCKLSMFALLINLKDCLRNEVVSLKSNTKILSCGEISCKSITSLLGKLEIFLIKKERLSPSQYHILYIARRKPN